MALKLEKASRKKLSLKMALYGTGGSGKTYTSLKLASFLSNGKPIGVIDTENRSTEKYVSTNEGEDGLFDFYIISLGNPDAPDDLSEYTPEKYIEALELFRKEGFETVIIDSLSHSYMWSLDEVNRQSVKYKGNTYVAWKDVTPRYNNLMRYIMNSNMNIISTLRSKTSYEIETNEKGRSSPKAVGTEPIIRAGFEFEFDIVGFMEKNNLIINKTRCFELNDKVYNKPGNDLGKVIANWLGKGISEEDEKKAKYIQFLVELQQQCEALGLEYERPDVNTMSVDEIIALGKSLRAKVTEKEIENKEKE